jgi:iron complex transport system ATP-binding protein
MNRSTLTVQQLHLRIANKTLCENLSIEFHGGQRWAILGMNGAGKTTLLHTLAGLRPPQQGNLQLNGKALALWSRRAMSQQLAVLFQDFSVPLGGRVLDYVLLGRHPHVRGWQWENADDVRIATHALACVDLTDLAERDVTTLSGGEKQRLAIALVIAQQPEIVILDEPVNHLDIRHQHQLLQYFSRLCLEQHKLMIMALHDIQLALRYCDHALLIFADGEIQTGEINQLLTSDNLSRLYAYPVKVVDTATGKAILAG